MNKLYKKNKEECNSTKDLIIDCAGKLISKYGYDRVTSKSICEEARVNIAAINYHFGSYDELYITILKEVHKYVMNIDELNEIYLNNLNPREKVDMFIDIFIDNLFKDKGWYIKVWAREIINPTPFIAQVFSQEVFPKLNIVAKIFSEYTKIPVSDPSLYSCIISTVSPFIVVFLAHKLESVLSYQYSKESLILNLKKIVLAGLEEFKV